MNNKEWFLTRAQILHRTLTVLVVFSLLSVVSLRASKNDTTPTRKGMMKINGTELYYEVMGKGTPIVIVHGGPGLDHTYFLPQMAALAGHHKLIFYDQRASGKSSNKVDTNSMTIANFVEDLEGIRTAFHIDKMNLLGHSWGGLVSMFYAIKYPENLNSLMLINSSPASVALRNKSFAVMAQRTSRQDSVEQAGVVQTEEFRNRDPKTMARFYKLLFRGTFYDPRFADSLTLTIDSSYPAKSKIMQYLMKDPEAGSYDLFSRLSVVHCPTLIIGTDHDMAAPEANERLHQSIPGSALVVLHHTGHFPFVESQKQFFSNIESFLNKVPK